MGSNQYWAERVYDLCVYYMTGTPEGSTESGFMEKPGIELATPCLQGIAREWVKKLMTVSFRFAQNLFFTYHLLKHNII